RPTNTMFAFLTPRPLVFVFFFSSRRRHTRFSRDWSSDVCSSDLRTPGPESYERAPGGAACGRLGRAPLGGCAAAGTGRGPRTDRSEERRVGKECRARWSPEH